MAKSLWSHSPIREKTWAKECVDFRTIGLVTHVSKTVLKVLSQRLESKAELQLGEDQYGKKMDVVQGMQLQHCGCCCVVL